MALNCRLPALPARGDSVVAMLFSLQPLHHEDWASGGNQSSQKFQSIRRISDFCSAGELLIAEAITLPLQLAVLTRRVCNAAAGDIALFISRRECSSQSQLWPAPLGKT